MTTLEQIFRSWSLSENLDPERGPVHSYEAGASEVTLDDFEQRVGWHFPPSWRRLYKTYNGASLFDHNLQLYPLTGKVSSVLECSAYCRGDHWPIPNELWVFGGNGQGDMYGLWVPPDRPAFEAVIELGVIHEGGCMAIAGSSLERFLLRKTVDRTLGYEGDVDAVLDVLAVPAELRVFDPQGEAYEAILRWADPDAPEQSDPYDACLTPKQVEEWLHFSESWTASDEANGSA